MRLYDVVMMLMRLLWKQFWFEELTDLNIGAEIVSQYLIGISHFITWLHGFPWRHAAEAVPYLSPPDMLRVTLGARLLDGHVRRGSIYYLASTHCTPRCAVKSEKKLNFRWQMYLAC